MATRSSFLFSTIDFAGGTETIFTCPDDVVALVKFLSQQNSNAPIDTGTASESILYHQVAGGALNPVWGWYEANTVPYQWPVWFVLGPGDSVQLYSDGVWLTSVVAYGALLPPDVV